MPISEGPALTLVVRRESRALEVVDEGDVGGGEVVPVHGVLDGELPVAPNRVQVASRHDVDSLGRVFADHVDELACAGEVLVEIVARCAERHEYEASPLRHPGHRPQGQAVTEVVPAVRLRTGKRDELALRVERPSVVEASEKARVAARIPSQGRAAVRARVEETMHRAFVVTIEDDGHSAHVAHGVVARFRHLGLMPEVEPRLAPDPCPLPRKELLRSEGLPVDLEDEVVPTLAKPGSVDVPRGGLRLQCRHVRSRSWACAGRVRASLPVEEPILKTNQPCIVSARHQCQWGQSSPDESSVYR